MGKSLYIDFLVVISRSYLIMEYINQSMINIVPINTLIITEPARTEVLERSTLHRKVWKTKTYALKWSLVSARTFHRWGHPCCMSRGSLIFPSQVMWPAYRSFAYALVIIGIRICTGKTYSFLQNNDAKLSVVDGSSI